MSPSDASQDSAPVRVVQLTDPHLFASPDKTLLGVNTRDSLRHVAEQVRREHPALDVLLCTGDLSQDGSVASYQAFEDATATLAARTRWLPGNHDRLETMAAVTEGSDRLQAVTDVGSWRIVTLVSTVPGATHGWLDDTQLAVLEQALEGAGERHCLVCLHHQPVDIGCAWMAPIGLRNAEALFACLQRRTQVKALLWGHVHQTCDRTLNGLRLLASPSTCIQFAPASEDFVVSEEHPGYRWLHLYPDGRLDTGVERARDFQVMLDLEGPGY